MSRTYRWIVGSSDAGTRLDQYLVHRLPSSLSRTLIQRIVHDGAVTIDERPVKSHRRLRCGEVVTATIRFFRPPAPDQAPAPQALPLEVAYEDDHLLVVNKPAGLVTHPAPGHWDGTLVNAILWHLSQRSEVGGQRSELPRAGIVHRLDKGTSGLLLVAKTLEAQAAMTRQMKARTIRRTYLAVAEGLLPLNAGTVNVPIGRHLTHRKVMSVRHLGGRSAVTHYRVLKRCEAAPLPFPCTVLRVALDTGRTHQIRVHLAHLGHPVVGDTTYGRFPASFWQPLGVKRQLLHAYRLAFRHPATGRNIMVSAPVPDDMIGWIDDATRKRIDALDT
jgi:23S rRNA pseudouridine1911/1915/1917 synthase